MALEKIEKLNKKIQDQIIILKTSQQPINILPHDDVYKTNLIKVLNIPEIMALPIYDTLYKLYYPQSTCKSIMIEAPDINKPLSELKKLKITKPPTKQIKKIPLSSSIDIDTGKQIAFIITYAGEKVLLCNGKIYDIKGIFIKNADELLKDRPVKNVSLFKDASMPDFYIDDSHKLYKKCSEKHIINVGEILEDNVCLY